MLTAPRQNWAAYERRLAEFEDRQRDELGDEAASRLMCSVTATGLAMLRSQPANPERELERWEEKKALRLKMVEIFKKWDAARREQ